MRSVTLSFQALETNLAGLHSRYGDSLVLDLRANAYALGASEVARCAAAVGIRRAYFSPAEQLPEGLEPVSSPADARAGWWSGEGGEVVTFQAEIISLKRVPRDTPVSYGYHYRTSTETTLALVCAGYADGLPRSASGSAQVSVNGTLVPVAGRIAMDQCVVDIGDTAAHVGDVATLWGASPTLAQWASWAARPQTALLTHIGGRVVRTWT